MNNSLSNHILKPHRYPQHKVNLLKRHTHFLFMVRYL